jgi:two-component system cell cycle sensor histidine kinase/response regulator CckA
MYSVPVPSFASQPRNSFATNSGPLSERMYSGIPRYSITSANASITSYLPSLRATRISADIGRVKADQGQIEQVIMNLAINARDAQPQGGNLVIETVNTTLDETFTRQHPGSKAGRYVMTSVTDSGTGMTPETLAHMFEPFFTTKDRGKGTGLGLATVYGVVKQSGGYILVESELGKGSCFKVYLPEIDEPVSAPVRAAPLAESFRGTETVLLVEDAEALRKLAYTLLEQNGYRVLAAASGLEALKVLEDKRDRIDLLLTDVIMPGINGRALAERLAPLQSGLKVLYMSGYTDSAIADHGVLDEGTNLLHKPFSEAALIQKIREVLDADTPNQPGARDVPVLAGNQATK